MVQVSAADVPDIFRARGMIEFAAVQAIREDDSELDLSEMEAAVGALKKLTSDVEWWEVVDADLAFHNALVAQGRSPRLSGMYKQLEGEIRLCLCVSTQFQVALKELVAEHVELLGFLQKRKYDRFEKALRATMEAATARVIAMLGSANAANGDAPS